MASSQTNFKLTVRVRPRHPGQFHVNFLHRPLLGLLTTGENLVTSQLGEIGVTRCNRINAFDGGGLILENAFDWTGNQFLGLIFVQEAYFFIQGRLEKFGIGSLHIFKLPAGEPIEKMKVNCIPLSGAGDRLEAGLRLP